MAGRYAGCRLPEGAGQTTDRDAAEYFKPVVALKQGLTDPIVGMSMGETAELLAHLFDISRQEADQYAVISHQRLAEAQTEGSLKDEIAAGLQPGG